MSEQPVLWVVLSALLSVVLVWLQYFYSSRTTPARWPLAIMRFLAIWGILLLLFDPKVKIRQNELQKHQLVVLTDNSRSIALKGADGTVRQIQQSFTQSQEIADRFDLQVYTFGLDPKLNEPLEFASEGTDIAKALETVSSALPPGRASIVLVSDGNDNYGSEYRYTNLRQPVFPVVVGDTTRFFDLRIDRVNMNRYAFLGNQYPVEILWSYSGQGQGSSPLTILDNGKVVAREMIEWAPGSESGRLEVLLDAREVGLHRITASLSPASEERNTENNQKTVGLEVLDERLDIRIVSTMTHPDLGALQRSLDKNVQRQCRIETPEETLSTLEGAGLLIIYQPDRRFASLYSALQNRNIPILTITGTATDWNFLNQVQNTLKLEDPGPPEYLLPALNAAFSYFDPGEWDATGYPPLEGILGDYFIQGDHQYLLEQRVRGINLGQPLFVLVRGDRREAAIFGSGLWRWSLQEFREEGNTDDLDEALSKVLLFLSAGKGEQRLTLDYQPVYEGLYEASVRARIVDEAFNFDPDAQLMLDLQKEGGQSVPGRPMRLRSGFYEYDLSQLEPGQYTFTVRAEGTGLTASGAFELQSFDMEARQISSDAQGLNQLAENTGGRLFFSGSVEELKNELLQSERFRPVQKSRVNVVSLIDYRWLLAFIVAFLAAEWFTRKYYGLN